MPVKYESDKGRLGIMLIVLWWLLILL